MVTLDQMNLSPAELETVIVIETEYHDIFLPKYFRWECVQCGGCCRYGQQVPLSPNEYNRLVREWRIFTRHHMKRLKKVPFFKFVCQVPRSVDNPCGLAIRQKNGHCIFLNPHTNRCLIYPIRPHLCVFYPFSYRHQASKIRSRMTFGLHLRTVEGIGFVCQGFALGVPTQQDIRHAKVVCKKYYHHIKANWDHYDAYISNLPENERSRLLRDFFQFAANGYQEKPIHELLNHAKKLKHSPQTK